jgi:hypothetical protein
MVSNELRQRLEAVFTPPQVEVFVDWAEEYRRNMVKVSDFLELKEIVRDIAEEQRNLAEAQRRTESRVEELAEAQQRTEVKVGELAGTVQRLAETQVEMQRTQAEMQQSMLEMQRSQVEMQQAIIQLARGLDEVRSLAGSNAQTLGYMLENEAYRHVPAWLKERHGIEVIGRMIRQQIGEEEINLLVEARQGEEEILIVGEAKSRLNPSDLGVLAGKVGVVKEQYAGLRGRRVLPLIVAHFAPEKALARAEHEGVIVAQSFEW